MFSCFRTIAASQVVRNIGAITCIIAVMWSVHIWFPDFRGAGDLGVYERIAKGAVNIAAGSASEMRSEYPPLATSIMKITFLHMPGENFRQGWGWMIAIFLGIAGIFLWRWDTKLLFSYTCIVLLFPYLFSANIAFGRYDVLVWTALILSVCAWRVQRFDSSGFFLAAAFLLKLIPVLLLPFLFWTTAPHGRKKVVRGFIIGTVATLIFCTNVLSWKGVQKNTEYVLSYHGGRGVQIESTWSGVHMLLSNLAGKKVSTKGDHMSIGNPEVGSWVLVISKYLIVGSVLCATAFLLWGRFLLRDYFLWSSMILLLAIGFSPVFSPQYVLWVLPTLLVWGLDMLLRGGIKYSTILWIVILSIGVALLTKWIYPLHYGALLKQKEILHTIILNVRNLGVFLLTIAIANSLSFSHWLSLLHRQRNIAILIVLWLPSTFICSWIWIDIFPHIQRILTSPDLYSPGIAFLLLFIVSALLSAISGISLLWQIARLPYISHALVYTSQWLWTQCRFFGRTSSTTSDQQLRLPLSTSY